MQAPTNATTRAKASHSPDKNNVPNFAELIRQCRDITSLRRLHSRIAASHLDRHTFLGNVLVDMYGKCGSPAAATAAFDRILHRNVFSWTILIAAFARNGDFFQAIVTFREMDQDGIRPNKVTFLAMADALSGYGDAALALETHQRILSSIDVDLVLATAMISMLGKCGIPAASEEEFLANREEIESKRCVIAWNAMLDAYARNGDSRECLDLFHQIVELDESLPDAVTIATVLSACSDREFLEAGRGIHARAVSADRMDRSTVVGNFVVRMYAQCEALDDAMAAFEEISSKSTVSWSIAVAALVQGGRSSDAVRLLWRMDQDGAEMDKIALVSAIGAIGGRFPAGRTLILERARAAGFQTDPFVGSAIVSSLARSDSFDKAWRSFEEIPDKRDIVVWNALIAALARDGRGSEAIDLFHRLSLEGIGANPATIASVFDGISTLDDAHHEQALAMAIQMEQLIQSTSSSMLVQNSMIDAFGKLYSPADARRIFDAMEVRSVVSWTAMIDAYARQGLHRQALLLFEQMELDHCIQANHFTVSTILASCARLRAVEEMDKLHERARSTIHGDDPDAASVVGSAFISSYGDCGWVEKSFQIFHAIGKEEIGGEEVENNRVLGSTCENTVVWNTMIEALSKNNRPGDAIQLFHAMDQAGVRPSSATFAITIAAFSKRGSVDQAREIHRRAATSSSIDHEILTVAMIDLYGTAGLLPEAQELFDDIAAGKRSMRAWNAIIAANARAGHSQGVVEIFHSIHLEGLEPDQATFSRLFESCCQSGLLDEAWERFIYMREDHGVEQAKKHWGSIVDALARAGSLSDASEVATGMPFRPSVTVWKILLHACQIHGEIWSSSAAAREASRLRPGDAVPYVLLANVYTMA